MEDTQNPTTYNLVHVENPHTSGRLVAVFPLNGYPADAYRVYIEDSGTPGINETDSDRFVVLDHHGARQSYRGGSWFPTFRAAVRRAVQDTGWGDIDEPTPEQLVRTAIDRCTAATPDSVERWVRDGWDGGDPWGSAMEVVFAVEFVCLNFGLPTHPEFRSPLGVPSDDDAGYLYCELRDAFERGDISRHDLSVARDAYSALCETLREHGLDY